MLCKLIIHERIVPQHVIDEITCQVECQCQLSSGDFKVISSVLELLAALVDHVAGRELLSHDQLLYRTVTRVMSCQKLFDDSHINTRVLELIDAVTRVGQHALFGNGTNEIPADEQGKCQFDSSRHSHVIQL